MKKIHFLYILVFIFGLFTYTNYNAIISQKANIETHFGEVQNQYQRRYDLINNLVNTIKGYTKHESETLKSIIEARAKATQFKITPEILTSKEFIQSQNTLMNSLSRLMVVQEQYPELKANELFKNLQTNIEGTENRIAVARNRWNNAIKVYNIKIQSFPTNIIAKFFGFQKEQNYKVENEHANIAPTVKFD